VSVVLLLLLHVRDLAAIRAPSWRRERGGGDQEGRGGEGRGGETQGDERRQREGEGRPLGSLH